MHAPQPTRLPCVCTDIGADGTRGHSGKRVWVVFMPHSKRYCSRTPACENHIQGYLDNGWKLARQPNQYQRWKQEKQWGEKQENYE